MKIVHILTRLLRAGSEENTFETCKAQIAAGHEVYLFHGCEFDAGQYEKVPGLKFVQIKSLVHPLAPGLDLKAFFEMVRRLRSLQADVVHTHQSKAGILGRFASRAAGVPVVIHGVHIVPFENVSRLQRLIYLLAEKAAAFVTHAFIDVSRGMREIYISAGVGRPENHHVVHSGFDVAKFANAKRPSDWAEILEAGQPDSRPPVIVMVAALEARKRHSEFLEEFVRVAARFPEVRLLMPGEGPNRAAVEATINRLGLAPNARLIGYRTDPEAIIAMADICVLASTREGLPRVVMQYLAGGKPCVVCDLPGLDEVLAHDVNGLVVAPDDMQEMADTLIDLLENPGKLTRLAVGAQATDLSSWDACNMGTRVSEIYDLYKSADCVR